MRDEDVGPRTWTMTMEMTMRSCWLGRDDNDDILIRRKKYIYDNLW